MKTKATDQKIESGGDDLGSIWYTFTGMTLGQSVDWIKRKGFYQYEVETIDITRRFIWFGKITKIMIVLTRYEGPSRHSSEFYDMLMWISWVGKHEVIFTSPDGVNISATVRNIENGKSETTSINPNEFRELYNAPGGSIEFLKTLWRALHDPK